jgi:hypothetical protein
MVSASALSKLSPTLPAEGLRPAPSRLGRPRCAGDQQNPGSRITGTIILLGKVAARTAMLDVACHCCSRRGRLSMTRLLPEHGPDMPVPEFLAGIMATCGEVKSGQLYDRCGVRFLRLPGLFP